MTIAEKIEMYKVKKEFVDGLNDVFVQNPKYHSVKAIKYEVWSKETNGTTYFEEWIVVYFAGGAVSPRRASGNSSIANFKSISCLIDGGYYDEVSDYTELSDRGYEFVVLETGSKLDALLEKPMKHISDVRECFSYCKNGSDVMKVIKMIPSVFGTFEVDFRDSDETDCFVICNEYYDEEGSHEEYAEYEFYEEA